jgi:hypothetical protein
LDLAAMDVCLRDRCDRVLASLPEISADMKTAKRRNTKTPRKTPETH